MRRRIAAGFAALIVFPAVAFAQEAKLLENFKDWAAHISSGTSKKICFIVSQPKDSAPKGVKRGPIYFYISRYPSEKVANEISVKMGYPLKSGVPVEIKIGGSTFKLFTKAEGAFLEKRADENKLVAAMQGGAQMTIQGRSARGTLTTDKYSLNGISAALSRTTKECP